MRFQPRRKRWFQEVECSQRGFDFMQSILEMIDFTVLSRYGKKPGSRCGKRTNKTFSNGIEGCAVIIMAIEGIPDCLPPYVPAIMLLALWNSNDKIYEADLGMRTLVMLQASMSNNWKRADGVDKNWTKQESFRKSRNPASKTIKVWLDGINQVRSHPDQLDTKERKHFVTRHHDDIADDENFLASLAREHHFAAFVAAHRPGQARKPSMYQPMVYGLMEDEAKDSGGFLTGSDDDSVVSDDTEALDNFPDMNSDIDDSGHSSDVVMNDAGGDLDDVAIKELIRNIPTPEGVTPTTDDEWLEQEQESLVAAQQSHNQLEILLHGMTNTEPDPLIDVNGMSRRNILADEFNVGMHFSVCGLVSHCMAFFQKSSVCRGALQRSLFSITGAILTSAHKPILQCVVDGDLPYRVRHDEHVQTCMRQLVEDAKTQPHTYAIYLVDKFGRGPTHMPTV